MMFCDVSVLSHVSFGSWCPSLPSCSTHPTPPVESVVFVHQLAAAPRNIPGSCLTNCLKGRTFLGDSCISCVSLALERWGRMAWGSTLGTGMWVLPSPTGPLSGRARVRDGSLGCLELAGQRGLGSGADAGVGVWTLGHPSMVQSGFLNALWKIRVLIPL